ncbi:hypothetical protein MRX96_012010 [Rhipicephalus microplus]
MCDFYPPFSSGTRTESVGAAREPSPRSNHRAPRMGGGERRAFLDGSDHSATGGRVALLFTSVYVFPVTLFTSRTKQPADGHVHGYKERRQRLMRGLSRAASTKEMPALHDRVYSAWIPGKPIYFFRSPNMGDRHTLETFCDVQAKRQPDGR